MNAAQLKVEQINLNQSLNYNLKRSYFLETESLIICPSNPKRPELSNFVDSSENTGKKKRNLEVTLYWLFIVKLS